MIYENIESYCTHEANIISKLYFNWKNMKWDMLGIASAVFVIVLYLGDSGLNYGDTWISVILFELWGYLNINNHLNIQPKGVVS